MDPPKSKTTIRISTDMGTASQYANSPMTVIELKGRTPQEKGQHYLQLSLKALDELASLLEDERLSEGEKAAYNEIYKGTMAQYDDMVQLREQLLAQKKSFRRFLVNLFVRESKASRFHKISYRNYFTIRRTSDDIHRRLLSVRNTFGSGSFQDSDVSVCEESPRDVMQGHIFVKDLPPNEMLRGISLDVNTEQEEICAFQALNRIATFTREEVVGDDNSENEEDDDRTIRAPTRPSSPRLTLIINNSVVALNSEVTGAAVTTS